MASLTFSKIEGITAGTAFTVNAFASDKTVTATVYFKAPEKCADYTKFTPKIGSVKVGGQNWLSTEIIKITYEMGIVENNDGIFKTLNGAYQWGTASHQVSEKDGTVSSSVAITPNNATSRYIGSLVTHLAYRITVESTQNLVGCKVVMSGFQLQADYTVQEHTVSLSASPTDGGAVTGGGDVLCGTSTTIKATPNPGYTFKEWQKWNPKSSAYETLTTSSSYTEGGCHAGSFRAVFEKIPPPEFTSASMLYLNKQITSTNKVACGEGYIISVGVK